MGGLFLFFRLTWVIHLRMGTEKTFSGIIRWSTCLIRRG